MANAPDYSQLCEEIKQLSGLTARDEATLHELSALIGPALDGVTERFYATLGRVRSTAEFIEGRVDILKRAHRAWLESLFARSLDAEYAKWLYQIGAVHVHVELPVEFMTAGMSLILRELLLLVGEAPLDVEAKTRAGAAIAAACTFSQLIMQRSYDRGRQASEEQQVQKITDISRKLFDNLTAVYKEYANPAHMVANDPSADIRPQRKGLHSDRGASLRRTRRVPRSHL